MERGTGGCFMGFENDLERFSLAAFFTVLMLILVAWHFMIGWED